MKCFIVVLFCLLIFVHALNPKKPMTGVKDLEKSQKFLNFVKTETQQKKFVLAFMYGKEI